MSAGQDAQPAEASVAWPKYCCVILTEPRSTDDSATQQLRCFMEVRDSKAKVSPGSLTCFGGKRDPGEDPLDCIARECLEEMNWAPKKFKRAVDFYVRRE